MIALHSRPRVSNDNAFSEALVRTCKYRPGYPPDGFDSLQNARLWVHHFIGDDGLDAGSDARLCACHNHVGRPATVR